MGADRSHNHSHQLISSGEEPPFLIVLPNEVNNTVAVDDTGFGNAVVNDLVPWIDQHYATCSDRMCRAIGGLSRGSGWALRLGLIHWQIFGAIGSHSISPFEGDYYLAPGWLQAITAATTAPLYRHRYIRHFAPECHPIRGTLYKI